MIIRATVPTGYVLDLINSKILEAEEALAKEEGLLEKMKSSIIKLEGGNNDRERSLLVETYKMQIEELKEKRDVLGPGFDNDFLTVEFEL